MKEYKVGEQFSLNIETIERIGSMNCTNCIFGNGKDMSICNNMACQPSERSDGKNVIFVEKGGEREKI